VKDVKEGVNMKQEFNGIYELYVNDIYRLVFSYILNPQDTQDILQRVFVKLFKNSYILEKEPDEIKKWLIAVAANEAKDFLRSFWKARINLVDLNNNQLTTEEYDKKNKLMNELKSIKKKYRIPLFLFYFEGYSAKEIADILHTSEASIKMKLSRGRKLLKQEMECE